MHGFYSARCALRCCCCCCFSTILDSKFVLFTLCTCIVSGNVCNELRENQFLIILLWTRFLLTQVYTRLVNKELNNCSKNNSPVDCIWACAKYKCSPVMYIMYVCVSKKFCAFCANIEIIIIMGFHLIFHRFII